VTTHLTAIRENGSCSVIEIGIQLFCGAAITLRCINLMIPRPLSACGGFFLVDKNTSSSAQPGNHRYVGLETSGHSGRISTGSLEPSSEWHPLTADCATVPDFWEDILLTRRGRVDGIRPERFRGRAELALTELGQNQARLLAQRIASDWSPNAVYCSPLQRCVATGTAYLAAWRLTDERQRLRLDRLQ
jgi:Histidine phosphatase superfamily (branch 1)